MNEYDNVEEDASKSLISSFKGYFVMSLLICTNSMAFHSLDVPGILARNTDDTALYFNALTGQDHMDSTTLDQVRDHSNLTSQPVVILRRDIKFTLHRSQS